MSSVRSLNGFEQCRESWAFFGGRRVETEDGRNTARCVSTYVASGTHRVANASLAPITAFRLMCSRSATSAITRCSIRPIKSNRRMNGARFPRWQKGWGLSRGNEPVWVGGHRRLSQRYGRLRRRTAIRGDSGGRSHLYERPFVDGRRDRRLERWQARLVDQRSIGSSSEVALGKRVLRSMRACRVAAPP